MVVSPKALALGFLTVCVLSAGLALIMVAVDVGPSLVALGFIALCVVAGLLAQVVVRPSPEGTRPGQPPYRS